MTSVHWNGYNKMAWVLRSGMLGSMLMVLAQGKMLGVFQLGIFMAISIFIVMYLSRNLPKLLVFFIELATVLNAGGWVWNLYDDNVSYYYDEIAHFFTPFVIILVIGYRYMNRYKYVKSMPKSHIILTLSAFGIALGGLWEIAEYVGYALLPGPEQIEIGDTISDMALDSAGSVLAAILSEKYAVQAAEEIKALKTRVREKMVLRTTRGYAT